MRVKHGAWISALGGGVEGGAVTITQTGKADKPWAMKEWAELACLMELSAG